MGAVQITATRLLSCLVYVFFLNRMSDGWIWIIFSSVRLASSASPPDCLLVSEKSLIKALIARPLKQLTNPGNWQSG